MSDYKTGRAFMEEDAKRAAIRFEQNLQYWCEDNHIPYWGEGNRDKAEVKYRAYLEEKRIREEEEERKRKIEEAEFRKRWEEQAPQRRLDSWFFGRVPPRYKDAKIEDFRMNKSIDRLLNGSSGILFGNNGPGKTHLMWALAREWTLKDEEWEIVKAQRFLSEIKGKDDPYGFMDQSFGMDSKKVHLVIDEIDKIFESRADFVYMNYLIDTRYEYLLQTICVGNCTTEDFIGALGQSVFSRLVGDGGVALQLNGEDRRLKNNEESNKGLSDK